MKLNVLVDYFYEFYKFMADQTTTIEPKWVYVYIHA